MDIRIIKNDRNFFWTNHSKYKLLQYGLSLSMVKKVINRPERTEEGIAPNTTALMKRKDSKKTKREVWVMYQKFGIKKKIISTWIYPGVSPVGKDIYIPDDAMEELFKTE
jgi:hypothetical protein